MLTTFLLFAAAFIVFQQHREKEFKIESLNMKLQDYNAHMHETLTSYGDSALSDYAHKHRLPNLRITVVAADGHVVFDNMRKDYDRMGNHAERAEIRAALNRGSGYDINRLSSSMNKDYFYSATYFPKDEIIIRTALPYDMDLAKQLQADQHYLWFALAVMVLLSIILYPFAKRLDTDFKQLYERLQKTKKEQETLKRQLTQNISHELKTPVASIKGYLETMLEHPDIDPEKRKQFLERSHAQTMRLTSLLADISTLNRMDDAPLERHFQRVDVGKTVETVITETALQMYDRRMTFDNRLPHGVAVMGDGSLIYSIFTNLTVNAIAYAGEGTRITLSAEQKGPEWHFTFSDNGQGVSEEHLPRLFDRFYRVDKGRSRQTGGTGLGLAIVKNAVIIHGGAISVANLPTGGLCFRWTLPSA